MFKQNSLFFKNSKKIAEEFLQTTVIVDDQAYFETDKSIQNNINSPAITELVEPGRRQKKRNPIEEPVKISSRVPNQIEERGSHVLDAQKVINSFAEKHIVCSVIKPTFDNNWISSVEKLASSADILILDWELKQDNGKRVKALLGKLLKSAFSAPEQIRLLVIYTGDPKIAEISKVIKSVVQQELNINADEIIEQDGGFALVVGSIRIVIFSKSGTNFLPAEYEHRKVSFDDLADHVTSEFTVMTAGLVSNVAITSLAHIRINTHKILNKFSSNLDAPYLTHRALQNTPDDAEDFLMELIAEEFRTLLDEESVGNRANINAIREWLESSGRPEFFLATAVPTSLSLDETVGLLESGFETCNKITNNNKKKPHKLPFTEMFSGNIADQSLDEQFGLITTVRTYYEKKKPKLTFGTILQKNRDKSYWLCMQPRCDSVRIDTNRDFPFLPLQSRTPSEKFRLIIANDTGHVRLAINDKPYHLSIINFTSRPDDHGKIIAKHEGKNYYFTSTNRVKFKWVGELKPEHAQRIGNEFAANLSRVGLDESEWLRL